MGCVATKMEEEEEVVGICRERKHFLKLAVEKRYALAEAHFKYCQSVYGVSIALKLFVARHSSSSSPFLITLPPPSPQKEKKVVSNPLFLQQNSTPQPNKDSNNIACGSTSCSCTSSSEEEEEEEDEQKVFKTDMGLEKEQEVGNGNGYFYMGMGSVPTMPSPQRDQFGWDFFDPFYTMRPEVMRGYNGNFDEDLRVVREQEGIPDLEEEEVEQVVVKNNNKVVNSENKKKKKKEEKESCVKQKEEESCEVLGTVDSAKMSQDDIQTPKGLSVVIDTPENGRELLEALKDIEDYFLRIYESGKGVSKMLESNRVQLQSGLNEIKESSTKLIQAITVRSTSYRSTTCKSLVASNSKTASAWTEFNNDLFDDGGGMNSGSHSLTLGRLYAWEKKLYEEVKAGDNTRKLYERKCSQLRNQDVKGDEGVTIDKTRAAVKDLYSRILVAIRSAESISERIDKLRDEELQPQIIELLHGMMDMWKAMLEAHEIQNKIMFEVKLFTCPTYGKFSNNNHRLATLQLEAELQNWRACFRDYLTAQKQYVGALYSWLSKFIVPEVELYSKSRNTSQPFQSLNGPPLLMICQDWFNLMDKLPDKTVYFSMKSFSKDLHALWVQQGKEQDQKRKADSLSKELDRKILAFQKTENRAFEPKSTNLELCEVDVDHQADYLKERKDYLDEFRAKVELERGKHQSCMQETQRITLNGLQTGFCRVFEASIEFSKGSLKMYHDLVSRDNPEKVDNSTYIQEDGCSR
uniref:protein ALTERED PHOSPHATE STARVATION RESPONSE 1-like n=1 Tax=Erigeron canadensis TaxID=72917 RepID=UPI001CB90976|nr:protein ALTERED PHOSPHATE STARVATION RESPONSE 1-like [Erigeron canadensis]